jgi:hypothetical protein
VSFFETDDRDAVMDPSIQTASFRPSGATTVILVRLWREPLQPVVNRIESIEHR